MIDELLLLAFVILLDDAKASGRYSSYYKREGTERSSERTSNCVGESKGREKRTE